MHAPQLGLRNKTSKNQDNVMIFEAVGTAIGNVSSCRIRTRFQHIKGFDVYLEISGYKNSKYLPKLMSGLPFEFIGFVDHLKCKHELDETKFKRLSTKTRYFEYTEKGILELVNSISFIKYTEIDIRHDVNVHESEDCIC